MRHCLSYIPVIFFAYACKFPASLSAFEPDSASNDGLKFCISYYRDGYYNRVIECVNDVLPNLSNRKDSLLAFKYLALSYGMINRIEKAEECFRIALDKNPDLEIDTLEFPPNIALIYKHVRLEKKLAELDTTGRQRSTTTPAAVRGNNNYLVPTFTLSGAILSAVGAGVLYFKGYEARRDYSTSEDQKHIDEAWNRFTYSMAGGAGLTLLCGVFTWLFFTLDDDVSVTTAIVPHMDGVTLTIAF